jgi:hypothetical protein
MKGEQEPWKVTGKEEPGKFIGEQETGVIEEQGPSK